MSLKVKAKDGTEIGSLYIPDEAGLKANLSQQILKVMKERKLSRYAFAKSLNLGDLRVKDWINCNCLPSLPNFILLNQRYGIKIEDVIGVKINSNG